MSRIARTSSQTVGPFFHDCLLRADAQRTLLASESRLGQPIVVAGRVLDGEGQPVPDAMLEIWQADAYGRYQHPADTRDLPLDPQFLGFGRGGTDAEGRYCFLTVKPGAVPFDATRLQAPHLCLAVFGRGLLNHLYTRLYFADEPATDTDPVLAYVPAERRVTLIALPEPEGERTLYRFDIVLQGPGETVFFNL
jgi:protocatechuate 3,4-dioxygenase alpha subunit